MMTVAEKEITQTYRRTSSLYKEAEKLLYGCRERHSWCRGCLAESDCRAHWDKLVENNDGLSLPMSAFNAFRRDLRRLEGQGFPRFEQSGTPVNISGAIVILGLACLVAGAHYGVLEVIV